MSNIVISFINRPNSVHSGDDGEKTDSQTASQTHADHPTHRRHKHKH